MGILLSIFRFVFLQLWLFKVKVRGRQILKHFFGTPGITSIHIINFLSFFLTILDDSIECFQAFQTNRVIYGKWKMIKIQNLLFCIVDSRSLVSWECTNLITDKQARKRKWCFISIKTIFLMKILTPCLIWVDFKPEKKKKSILMGFDEVYSRSNFSLKYNCVHQNQFFVLMHFLQPLVYYDVEPFLCLTGR